VESDITFSKSYTLEETQLSSLLYRLWRYHAKMPHAVDVSRRIFLLGHNRGTCENVKEGWICSGTRQIKPRAQVVLLPGQGQAARSGPSCGSDRSCRDPIKYKENKTSATEPESHHLAAPDPEP
jgi:hypothetical protein